MEKYRSVHHSILEVMFNKNTELRRRVQNVARLDDEKPTSEKSTLGKTGSIKTKIVDEDMRIKSLDDPQQGGEQDLDNAKQMMGGITMVELSPKTNDKIDTERDEDNKGRSAAKKQNKLIGQKGAPAMKEENYLFSDGELARLQKITNDISEDSSENGSYQTDFSKKRKAELDKQPEASPTPDTSKDLDAKKEKYKDALTDISKNVKDVTREVGNKIPSGDNEAQKSIKTNVTDPITNKMNKAEREHGDKYLGWMKADGKEDPETHEWVPHDKSLQYGDLDKRLSLAQLAPNPLINVPASAIMAYRNARRGDYTGAAIDAASSIPVVGSGVKAASMGAKAAYKVTSGLNKAGHAGNVTTLARDTASGDLQNFARHELGADDKEQEKKVKSMKEQLFSQEELDMIEAIMISESGFRTKAPKEKIKTEKEKSVPDPETVKTTDAGDPKNWNEPGEGSKLEEPKKTPQEPEKIKEPEKTPQEPEKIKEPEAKEKDKGMGFGTKAAIAGGVGAVGAGALGVYGASKDKDGEEDSSGSRPADTTPPAGAGLGMGSGPQRMYVPGQDGRDYSGYGGGMGGGTGGLNLTFNLGGGGKQHHGHIHDRRMHGPIGGGGRSPMPGGGGRRMLKNETEIKMPTQNQMFSSDINFGVSSSLIEAAASIMEKKLVGNQKKIDANHNGKIDADDFKKLRADDGEKKEKCPKCGMMDCKCNHEEVREELKGNQSKIDANHNGKIDSDDFKKLRSRKKTNESVAHRIKSLIEAKRASKKEVDEDDEPLAQRGSLQDRQAAVAMDQRDLPSKTQGMTNQSEPKPEAKPEAKPAAPNPTASSVGGGNEAGGSSASSEKPKLGQQRSQQDQERSDEKIIAKPRSAGEQERSDEKIIAKPGRSAGEQERSDEKKIGSTDTGAAKPQSNRQAEMGKDDRTKPAAPAQGGQTAKPAAPAPKPGAQTQKPGAPAAKPEAKPEEGGNWFTRKFGATPKGPAPVPGANADDQSPLGALRQYNDAKSKGAFDKPAAPAPQGGGAPPAAAKPAPKPAPQGGQGQTNSMTNQATATRTAAKPAPTPPTGRPTAPAPAGSAGDRLPGGATSSATAASAAQNRGPADQQDRIAAAAAAKKKQMAGGENMSSNVG